VVHLGETQGERVRDWGYRLGSSGRRASGAPRHTRGGGLKFGVRDRGLGLTLTLTASGAPRHTRGDGFKIGVKGALHLRINRYGYIHFAHEHMSEFRLRVSSF